MVNKRQSNKRRNSRRGANQGVRAGAMRVLGLPQRYPSAPGDQARMNFRGALQHGVSAGQSASVLLIGLGKGTSSTGYNFLNDFSALFAANANVYSRFMIESLTVEVRATGIGSTSNSFLAASYTPSNTTVDNPPAGISELSQSNHYCESSLGTTGKFVVRPCEFFNDWKNCIDSDDSDAQAGVVQLIGLASAGSTSAQLAGIVTLSGVIHFCGLRT